MLTNGLLGVIALLLLGCRIKSVQCNFRSREDPDHSLFGAQSTQVSIFMVLFPKSLISFIFGYRKLAMKIDCAIFNTVVTEDRRTYLFTSADDNNVVDDMMMMMMMCPHVSS